ncbi:MAG TPA: hybrid sensor histidine kinase/response regulator, partial [Burkholderiaceae bacterium]
MQSTAATSSTDSESTQGEHDLGPLAWVLDELRKSLDGAVKALHRFVRDAELARDSDLATLDTSALRIARQQLHQASGALDMVGMQPPAFILRAMEAAVQKFVQRPELCTDEAAGAIERMSFALSEYLDSVLAGKPASAVELFPQYRDMQALVGGDPVHPADLWPLERRLLEPADSTKPIQAMQYGTETRALLDQNLLRIVKTGSATASRRMSDLCLSLAVSQTQPSSRAFWKIAAGFFEALGQGLLTVDVYVKRAASRILLQYTTLARDESQEVPPYVLQELLFFCAQAHPKPQTQVPALSAVRVAFALDDYQVVDYQAARFGRFDPAL